MPNRWIGVVSATVLLASLTGFLTTFAWTMAVSSALTAVALWIAMEQSKLSGPKLVITLAMLYAGITHLSSLIEGVAFHVATASEAVLGFAGGAITAALVSIWMVVVSGRWRKQQSYAKDGLLKNGLAWRIPVGALCYCILYLAAGVAVYPFVKEFYASKLLPSLPELFGLQFFRGLLYILLVLPWLKTSHSTRAKMTGSLATLVPILGGLAPLLLAGSFMPAEIQLAHAIEIGVSNFLFGLAVGFLLLSKCERVPKNADLVARQDHAVA